MRTEWVQALKRIRKRYRLRVRGLVERKEVDFAWRMLRQVRTEVAAIPGLIAGIIEYGD